MCKNLLLNKLYSLPDDFIVYYDVYNNDYKYGLYNSKDIRYMKRTSFVERPISVLTLKHKILKYLEYLKKLNLNNQKLIIIADNHSNSIALILAAIEMNLKPIVVTSNILNDVKDLPSINYNQGNDIVCISSLDYIGTHYGYFRQYDITKMINKDNSQFEKFISCVLDTSVNICDVDYFIHTSGTTKNAYSIVPMNINSSIKSNQIFEKLITYQDTIHKGSGNVSYLNLSSISGFVLDLLLPIMFQKSTYLLDYYYFMATKKATVNGYEYSFKSRDSFKIVNDFFRNSKHNRFDSIKLSDLFYLDEPFNVNNVFFAGMPLSFERLRECYLYEIDDTNNIGEKKAYNCYATSEANGFISVFDSNFSSLKTLENEKFDLISLMKGKVIISNTEYCMPLVPVGVYDKNIKERVKAQKDLVDYIYYDGICTGDLGFVHNDYLYVIGRSIDIIKYNGEMINMNLLAQYLQYMLKDSGIFIKRTNEEDFLFEVQVLDRSLIQSVENKYYNCNSELVNCDMEDRVNIIKQYINSITTIPFTISINGEGLANEVFLKVKKIREV